MYGDPSHKKTLHSLFLTICEKMSAPLLDQYFASLRTNIDRMDTLTEFLHLLNDLSARCPSPQQWLVLFCFMNAFKMVYEFWGQFQYRDSDIFCDK